MADVTFPRAPGVNFACKGADEARVAYVASFVLAAFRIQTLVTVGDNNVLALDEEVWNTPVGTYRCIIVGMETFNLLPVRTQEWVHFPPHPESTDYWGAVGFGVGNDVAFISQLLTFYITEPPTSGRAGAIFTECWRAIIRAEEAAGGPPR